MTMKKAARKATKTNKAGDPRKQPKRRKDRGDCPIGIGGGNGIARRSDTISGIVITFDRSKYVPVGKKRLKWVFAGNPLTSLTIIDEGQVKVPPVLKSNSKISVNCVNTNTGANTRIPIKIFTNPIGIEMTDDFVEYPDYFGCSYLGIKEIPVDDDEVPSLRGRCLFKAHTVG